MIDPAAYRRARVDAGLRVREIAKLSDLDPSTISLYERGRSRPSEESLRRWRGALRLSLELRIQAIAKSLESLIETNTRTTAEELPGDAGATTDLTPS